MVTTQNFVAAVEDFAITRLFYEALVREFDALLAFDLSREDNVLTDRYERIQSAAASAQTALNQYELNLLAFLEGEYVDVIENALSRLGIAGGTEAAKAITIQLQSRYYDGLQIPKEAR